MIGPRGREKGSLFSFFKRREKKFICGDKELFHRALAWKFQFSPYRIFHHPSARFWPVQYSQHQLYSAVSSVILFFQHYRGLLRFQSRRHGGAGGSCKRSEMFWVPSEYEGSISRGPFHHAERNVGILPPFFQRGEILKMISSRLKLEVSAET